MPILHHHTHQTPRDFFVMQSIFIASFILTQTFLLSVLQTGTGVF